MPIESSAVIVRRLRHTDLDAALVMQSQSYPAFLLEGEAAFLSRLNLPTSYCLAATRGGVLIGYLLACGWPSQALSPIGTVLTTDAVSKILFVHDLASLPSGQGSGIGRTLVMVHSNWRLWTAFAKRSWSLWKGPRATGKGSTLLRWPQTTSLP